MKKYENYKDSGLEWLGMVPEHWEILPFKRGVSVNNGRDYKHVKSEDGYPVIGSGGQFAYASDYLYDGEVILLGRKGTIDKPRYFSGKFWTVDTMFYAIPNQKCIAKYMYYQALTIPFSFYSTDTALPSMTQSDLGNHLMCFPPISEQRIIASYLDQKVGQIDALISEKEKMVEDLKAYRSSLITETVTKGLDKEVEMKDSGVEWIRRIPSTWKSSKIGRIYSDIGSGTTPDSNNNLYYKEDGFNWLQTGDLTDGYITETSRHISQLAIDEKHMRFYPVDSIVVAMYGATIGKVGFLKIETSTNQACCVLPPSENMDAMYMFYMMQASKEILISNSIGGGQPNISQSIIKEHIIPVPPLRIQKEIALYLQNKIGKIVSILSEQEHQLSDLKSYKSSLITEAVTGKIDLRDWQTKKS